MPYQPENINELVSIDFEPSGNCNLLQFNILRIVVRVRRRSPGAVGPFRVIIRTNLNQARRIRRQIIDAVEKNQTYSTDYYDIPATYDPHTQQYIADILVHEIGYFEFKVRAESTQRGHPWVRWADGPNVGVSVTALEYARNNAIYCAFIRQYVPDKHRASLQDTQLEATIEQLEHNGAYVLPPGGNFDNFLEVMPFIVRKLGMKIIHLLPINPVPTSYGRMGRYGSPYATTDYFGIDHTYATFSKTKTIEDQFVDLVATIHGYGAKVFLDMVINHTGWASSILFTHRHWVTTDENQQIVSPGAWGVVWEDLVELDYRHKDLWQYMARVFLTWCRRGVDGFRLDAGYMVPLEVWRYIIAKVREEYPKTVFLLEGLGGPWETTEQLLTVGQMNWAYSELFQNYSRRQITEYLEYAQKVSARKGVMVHYAETHDNDRLAKKGKAYTRLRLYLSALTSFAGAWGFTNGVEWLATEKINVHRNTALNWGNSDNLVDEIARVNRILADNPAFWQRDNLNIIDVHNDKVLAFVRSAPYGDNHVICAINLDAHEAATLQWNLLPLAEKLLGPVLGNLALLDLLSDQIEPWPTDHVLETQLGPGQCAVYRLLPTPRYEPSLVPAVHEVNPDRIALIYRILLSRFHAHEVGRIPQEKLLRQVDDLRRFIVLVNKATLLQLVRGNLTEMLGRIPEEELDRYSAVWTFRAATKEFIISGDKWLMVHTFVPCTAQLKTSRNGTIAMESIACSDGQGHMAFFPPLPENESVLLSFNWKIQRDQMIQRRQELQEYPILSAPSAQKPLPARNLYPLRLGKRPLTEQRGVVLLTNSQGLMCQCPTLPSTFNSKYDSLFCLAPDADKPSERISLLKTVRETVQVGQKYFDLDRSFLASFTRYPHPTWEFRYNDGEFRVHLQRIFLMPTGENTLCICYRLLEANTPVRLFATCLLEYRNPHQQVKLSQAPAVRHLWPEACELDEKPATVNFRPTAQMALRITGYGADFLPQPAWREGIHFPEDAERGYDATGDAFTPGLFTYELRSGDTKVLTVSTCDKPITPGNARKRLAGPDAHWRKLRRLPNPPAARKDSTVAMLAAALDQFVVAGPGAHHLVAGYPWLPAASRDGLLAVGGLIAAGRHDVARDVILAAARACRGGLVGEWLSGAQSTYRTIEPALRLPIAAAELARLEPETALWSLKVDDDRKLRDVVREIWERLRQDDGKADCRIDPESSLLFCPANFSWMHTNHPQATPRPGYPVEIQALWFRVLHAIAAALPETADEAFRHAERIEQRFQEWFWDDQRGYAADLLKSEAYAPAAKAAKDMTFRFNQLETIQAGLIKGVNAQRMVAAIAQRLLIPGGVRSLAEEPLDLPLRIVDAEGNLLADPRMPYQGQYVGDETRRRVAMHNGTAWVGAYPMFIEAYVLAHESTDLARRQGLAFFEPLWSHLAEAGIGCISEMKDGNFPHLARGCYAYAAATAETLRVYLALKYPENGAAKS